MKLITTYILFVTSLIAAFFISISSNNFYPLVTYLSLTVILIFINKKKRLGYNIFFINVIFSVLLFQYYMHIYGVPYFGGGSDALYSFEIPARTVLTKIHSLNYTKFFKATILVKGNWDVVGYVYIVAIFMKLGSFLGLKYTTIVPVFFNSFLVTNICFLLKKISLEKLNFSKKEANITAYIYGLFPLVMFINANAWRDTLFCFLFISFIYLTISNKKYSNWLACICLILLSQLRLEYTVPILIMWLLIPYIKMTLLNVRNKKKIFFTILLLLLGLGIIGMLLYQYVPLTKQIIRTTARTNQLRMSEYDSASFIAALPWYLMYPSKLLYLILSPFPTLGSLPHMFQGFGTLVRLFFSPAIFYGAIKALKYKNFQETSIWFFFFLFVVGFGSLNFKHRIYFLPFESIFFVFGLRYFKFRSSSVCIKLKKSIS